MKLKLFSKSSSEWTVDLLCFNFFALSGGARGFCMHAPYCNYRVVKNSCVLVAAGAASAAGPISYTRKQGACRTVDGGSGESDAFQNVEEVSCKAKCDADNQCNAYEYNPSNQYCEVHNKPGKIITQGSGASHLSCFIKGITCIDECVG